MRGSSYSTKERIVDFLRATWERIFPWTFVRRQVFNEFVSAYDEMLRTFWTREEEHYIEITTLKEELENTSKKRLRKRTADGRFA